MRPYFYIANSVRDDTHIQIHGDSVSVDKKKRVEQERVEEVAESLHSGVERVGLVPGCVPSGSGSENVHLDEELEMVARSISRDVGCSAIQSAGLGSETLTATARTGSKVLWCSFQSSAPDSLVIDNRWCCTRIILDSCLIW